MQLESLLTNPNPTVPRSRSLLSRLTNPLAKHSRVLSDFYVEPEVSLKTYSPGDKVKGSVVLGVTKGFDVTHLVVALHGYAKVYKNQVVPGEGTPDAVVLVNGKGSSEFEYHGNGLASLFQDEIVLCGSGFLQRQKYSFGFELEFPPTKLPSTIEFERGTVSYVISATLTRPTTITPNVTCSRKIRFHDIIDVAPFATPKTKVISLEPISKRGRVRKVRHSPQSATAPDSLRRQSTDVSTAGARALPLNAPPMSPAPSEDTVASATTTSSQSFQIINHPSNTTGSGTKASDPRSSTTSSSSQMITATAEILKQGALKGESIPVRLLVSHKKPNLRGAVIVTLYRLARVDMHPAIPMGRKGKAKAEYEDIFPKSRTGLGGLYFSNGSPNSLYRKDLAQSSTMMVVDPRTLTADVRTSIRIPEDAFPTIANIQGDMISFKYYVEVVVDIGGKLGETRLLPSLTSNGPTFTYTSDNNNQLTTEWANNILDTTQLRRTKSVVDFTFSIIIGTTDSGRDARRQDALDQANLQQRHYDQQLEVDQWQDHQPHQDQYDSWGYDGADAAHLASSEEYYDYHPPPTQLIPPPEPEEAVDEKTRLRRQEELLLPSQPPQEDEAPGSACAVAPSAPYLPDFLPDEDGTFIPVSQSAISTVSTRSADTITSNLRSSPRPPVFDGGRSQHLGDDDKQELERQRLMAQASAPPPDDHAEASESGQPILAASAPVIDEEEEYNAHTLNQLNTAEDHLPQYWR